MEGKEISSLAAKRARKDFCPFPRLLRYTSPEQKGFTEAGILWQRQRWWVFQHTRAGRRLEVFGSVPTYFWNATWLFYFPIPQHRSKEKVTPPITAPETPWFLLILGKHRPCEAVRRSAVNQVEDIFVLFLWIDVYRQNGPKDFILKENPGC